MADFNIDKTNRIFTVIVSGFTKEKTNFVEDLKKNVASINPKDYTLLLDGEEMKTFKPEILPTLEVAYSMYMSFGFKKIVVLNPKRVTPRLQIQRIAKNSNFTGKFVNGREEALKLASSK